MRGSPTRRRVSGLVFGGVLAGLALTGCTSPPTAAPTASAPGTSVAPTPSAQASSAAASPTASATPSAPAGALTIDITIADGQVSPSGKKIDVKVGQTIVLNVTSDADDEVHAHTEGDGYELEVSAGKPATGTFSIAAPGSYEVESHHLEKVIVILNAR